MKISGPTLKLPPFVHVTVGPDAIPDASVAVKLEAPVVSDSTERVDGLKETRGAVISATGAGGVVVPPLLPPPPPQADKSSADAIESLERWVRFK